MNIANLDCLISHLEGLPEERFNMGYATLEGSPCGAAACIQGHACALWGGNPLEDKIGMSMSLRMDLVTPDDWKNDAEGANRYPLSRAIRTLKHMRSEYLRTGEVVVDWDAPEPAALKEWAAPKASERVLPEELVSLLRPTSCNEVVS